MSFRSLAHLTTALCAFLAVGLMFAPGVFAATFGLDPVPEAAVMARRAAVLFVGLGGLIYCTRALPQGPARHGVALSIVAMMAGLALLGLAELALGRVGWGIFVAVLPETLFALLYLPHLRGADDPVT